MTAATPQPAHSEAMTTQCQNKVYHCTQNNWHSKPMTNSNAKQVGLTLGRRSVVFALCLFKEKKIIEIELKKEMER